MTTIDAVASHLSLPTGALLKAFPVVVEDDRGMVMVVVRGDHRVNEIKLQNALKAPFRPAQPDEVQQRIGPPGYIGPAGTDLPILLDHAGVQGAYVAGANEPDAHLAGVEPGPDFPFEARDVRAGGAGDPGDGGGGPRAA